MHSRLHLKAAILLPWVLVLVCTIAVAEGTSSSMTAKLTRGTSTSEIRDAQFVFKYLDTRGYMLGGEDAERAVSQIPIIINGIEKQSIPLDMIEEMSLKAGKRPHSEVKHWTVRFLDVEVKLSNGKSLKGEIGTYLPLPAEGKKKADSADAVNIHDIQLVGMSSDTGLKTEVSLYDVSRIILQRKR